MNKTHMVRIILSALLTALIIKTVGVMIRLDTYSLAKLVLDAQELNIVDFAETARTIQVFIWILNYALCILICIAIWKWFGLPNSIKPRFLSRFKFSRYQDNEETIEEDGDITELPEHKKK